MDRREFVAALGTGVSIVVAGCAGVGDSQDASEDESEEESEEESVGLDESDLEQMRDDYYDDRVEDEMQVKSHVLNINGIQDISGTTMIMNTDISINPVDDYDINLHYNVIEPSTDGNWRRQDLFSLLHREPEYDDETEQWVTPETGDTEIRYHLDEDELGTSIDSQTIPSDVFWGEDDSIEMVLDNRRESELEQYKMRAEGFTAVLEFDVSDVPMDETGVFTLTWEDKNNASDRGGELITNSRPVLRTAEDAFIYPQDNGLGRRNTYSHHSLEEAYLNDFESGSPIDGSITRVSNYSYHSDRHEEFYKQGDSESVEVGSTDNPAYLDSPIQFPWNINYTISESEYSSAESDGKGVIVGEGLGYDSVHAMINDDGIMNHEIIEDVASQIGEVCEKMNATHSTEQLRVVADVVQYLSHYADDADTSNPRGLVSELKHPVVTLATGEGDCKDFTVLGNAILQQEPFNMSPDAFVIERLPGTNDISHVSTSVPVSELGGDDFANDIEERVGTPGSVYALAQNGGEEHAYIEMSGPLNLGYIQDDWLDNEELQPIDSLV